MRAFLNRLFGAVDRLQGPEPVRDRGRPPSGNGASSFHLIWQDGPQLAHAVRATLEVAGPPTTNDLYFFALQATFTDRGRDLGGAHVGLQWNARHPGNTAVNWGGYRAQDRGGAILEGTESELPSTPNDPNTRDFPWRPQRRYRFEIGPARDDGWWPATVADLASGEQVTIRELHGGGSQLRAPMVWCEVFARCDAPSVEVRWTDLAAAPDAGIWEPIATVAVNYQSFTAGGCTNTDSSRAGAAVVQRTSTDRVTAHGQHIRLDSS